MKTLRQLMRDWDGKEIQFKKDAEAWKETARGYAANAGHHQEKRELAEAEVVKSDKACGLMFEIAAQNKKSWYTSEDEVATLTERLSAEKEMRIQATEDQQTWALNEIAALQEVTRLRGLLGEIMEWEKEVRHGKYDDDPKCPSHYLRNILSRIDQPKGDSDD